MGLVYHKTEASSLTHDCKLDGSGLVCEFTQASIRRKIDPKDITAKIEEARKEYRENKAGFDVKECASLLEYKIAIKTGVAPKNADNEKFTKAIASMSIAKRKDLTKTLDAGAKFCQNKSEKNFLDFAKINIDKDVSTCSISTHNFSQRFKHFPETGTWVVTQNRPESACGIVNVSRFQPEATTVPGSDYKFWKYISKKVVTNKLGNTLLLKCSDFDEGECEYDWRSREIELGCRYITFGVF